MKSRILILLLIIGIGAIAIGWVYESRLRPGIEKAELIIPEDIDYFLTNLNYRVMTATGNLDYEFISRRMEHHPQTDVSYIEVPSLQIYRQSDLWQVDALQGEIQHRDNLMRLHDQVVIKKQGDNPLQLYTNSIRFEPDRDLVTIESSVLMQTKQARIEAEQAVFNLSDKIYSLRKARAIYYHDNS